MDINDLSKYQLVLLVLMVSFVTSIATGIMTVSLLQQEQLTIGGVINKVVERTIQQVVPTDENQNIPQTVIIKEDDLIAEALATGFKETVRLLTQVDASVEAPASTLLLSLGPVIQSKGLVVVPTLFASSEKTYAVLDDVSYAPGNVVTDSLSGLSFFTLEPRGVDAKPLGDIGSLPFEKNIRVGQTALIIGDNGKFIKTVISEIKQPAKSDERGGPTFSVNDDIPRRLFGAPVISNDGKLLGIVSQDVSGLMTILSTGIIEKALDRVSSKGE